VSHDSANLVTLALIVLIDDSEKISVRIRLGSDDYDALGHSKRPQSTIQVTP